MEEKKLLEEILNEIKISKKIICLRHINPDGDAFGSQLGIKKLINLNWPEKEVYATGSKVSLFETMGKMDEINDEEFKDALLIISDTGSTSRIDDQRWKKAKKVIKIDHHSNDSPYGHIQWVDSSFTSASEMIGWFAYRNNLKINEEVAKTILYGITTDSNRFFATNVNSRTFLTCSYLMSPNWDITDLFQEIYRIDKSFLYAQAEVIKTAEINDGVGALFLTNEIMEKYKISYEQNDVFTNLLQGVKEIEIYVVFSANKNGTYRTEFRSKKIPINEVAQKYGGGGHKLIAGATISNLTVAYQIINDLKQLIK